LERGIPALGGKLLEFKKRMIFSTERCETVQRTSADGWNGVE